jgi:hypothetical protein
MRLQGVGWWVTAALVFVPTLAKAAGTATELAAAREFWEQAQAAQERNDWSGCEQALLSALPIVATPGLRFHLAHCREMQGKWVEALVDYKLVDEMIQSGTPAPDVAPLLDPAIKRLELKTPKLTVELVDPPKDLSFVLDGKSVSRGLLNTRLSLNPGRHQLEIQAPGYAPFTRRVVLLEGETRVLPLRLVNAPDVIFDDAQASEDSDSLQRSLMIAEAAFTLGAGSMALFYHLEANAAPSQDARDSASTNRLVWGISSGVGIVSFFATWLLWSDNTVAVGATSSGAHVTVTGRY